MKGAAIAAVLAFGLVIAAARAEHGEPDAAMGLEIPDHWRELPEMIRNLPVDPAVMVVSRGAWGDPVDGVFLLAQRLETTNKGNAAKLEAAMLEALTGGKLELKRSDPAAKPMTLSFTSAGFTGGLVAHVASPDKRKLRVSVVACFYNQREPEISEQLCKVLLTKFAASP